MAVFGKDTEAVGKFAGSVPVPEFKETSFSPSKPLDQAKVAIVTTAALYREGGSGFELGDGDLEKQEEQFARININTNERIRVRRLPGTCIYPNMPQGVRCEVQYVLFEREAREFQSFHFLMFQFRGSNQTHRSLMSL